MPFKLPETIEDTIKMYERFKRKDELNIKCCKQIPNNEGEEYISDLKESLRFNNDIISWLTELKERREEEDREKMKSIGMKTKGEED